MGAGNGQKVHGMLLPMPSLARRWKPCPRHVADKHTRSGHISPIGYVLSSVGENNLSTRPRNEGLPQALIWGGSRRADLRPVATSVDEKGAGAASIVDMRARSGF